VIHVVPGDLASVAADAVARPATTRLEPLTPALQRLDAAAGPKFIEQIQLRRELPPGAAVVTGAGDLVAEFVVHLVMGEPDTVTTDIVRRCTEAAMWHCTQWNIQALACPIPAAGNLAPEAALDALLGVVRAHMKINDYPASVLVVTSNDTEQQIASARIGQGGS
jgi:O-acetyl-ADP-ribose deacetylase (regulator of RNase III)